MAGEDKCKPCSACYALKKWAFYVAALGAFIPVMLPVGERKRSLGVLMAIAHTHTWLELMDNCDRQDAERQRKLLEELNATTSAASADALLDES